MTYRVEFARPARRALAEELPETVSAAAWELITGPLCAEPHRHGKQLRAPFAGEWVARRSSYRVRYRIDDDRQIVTIMDVRGRADIYLQ